ncbi:methyl-accepting chemotaxis protein [Geomonas agri]|uniref:methyl-accepting chemotaxis protein n=1 Tax=Geomonas agri TaxID=2873702 RepID=UPI001CD3A94C|nr:methyl-accepting chemotaxis protein [Geomonas agri]
MQWFNDASIRTKLVISFLLLLVLTALLGGLTIVRLGAISGTANDLAQRQLPSLLSISKIQDYFGSYRRGELLQIVSTEQKDVEKYIKRNSEMQAKLQTELENYRRLMDSDEERRLFTAFTDELKLYQAEDPKISELALVNKDTEAGELVRAASSTHFNAALKALDELMAVQVKQTMSKTSAMDSSSASSRTRVMAALVLCLVLGIAMACVIAHLMSTPLRALAGKADQIAKGDLNVEVEETSRDEIGHLSGAFAAMTHSLKEMIGRLTETARGLSDAAGVITAGAQQISVGTEEVAAQAATVSVASEQMAATSADIARNCQLAAGSAKEAAVTTQEGFQVVQRTVDGIRQRGLDARANSKNIESLAERSDQIGAIVATIEDIADQTNLLALNAAIEAARAGEQGRGFAVVADEVRALAERTTRATKEIGDMIRAIQGETKSAIVLMENGVRGAEQEAEAAAQLEGALQLILAQVDAVSTQVSQIATAAEEQTATTGEISSNIQQITQVVNETSRSAEESVTAASGLTRRAEELISLVQRFRI